MDYNLQLEIPLNSLCPPIPNRLDYLGFLDRLLSQSVISGIDMYPFFFLIYRGTGASCIYPLLGCRLHPSWDFLATDIYAPSIEYAQANVNRNHLQDRIRICHSDPSYILPTPFLKPGKTYDFVMCNPPFYESIQDQTLSRTKKTNDPFAVCTGASHEMITEGGELKFVRQMIQESFGLQDCIHWFTCLLGKKADYIILFKELEDLKGLVVQGHTITQGHTVRWILAWSFETLNRPEKRTRLEDIKALEGPSEQ